VAPEYDDIVAENAGVALPDRQTTFLHRLAKSLGYSPDEVAFAEKEISSHHALLIRPIGEGVRVGWLDLDRVAEPAEIDKEVVLKEGSVVEFEETIMKTAIEEEISAMGNKGESSAKSVLQNWFEQARKDHTFIRGVLENHRRVEARAEEVSRRAEEVMARYER